MNRSVRRWLLLLPILLLALAAFHGIATADDGTTYVVEPGDTLVDIADTYHVSIYDLIRVNNISDPALLAVGQSLIIPNSTTTSAAVATAKPTAVPASPTAVPVTNVAAALAAPQQQAPAGMPQWSYNPYASYGVRPGDLINATAVPTPTSIPTPAPTKEPRKTTKYTVQPGDQLGEIAMRYDISLDALVAVNNLADPETIIVGQVLTIPDDATVRALPPPPVNLPKKIVVSISKQRMQVYQGDKLLWNWPASTARAGYPTRVGTFTILDKMPSAFGSVWDIDMPYWMGIYYAGGSENGIHGLPVSRKSGVKVWQGYVGTPITFGCVMISDVNARQLYAWADVGTQVVINS